MFWSPANRQLVIDQAAASPLGGEVTDFDAAYARALSDQRTRLNSDSRQNAITAAYDDYADDIWRQTGQRLTNPYRIPAEIADAHQGEGYAAWWQSRLDQFHTQAADLAAKAGIRPQGPDDLMGVVAQKVRDSKAMIDAPTTAVGWSGLGSFLGSAQGAMEDPLNAVSMLFGAPAPTRAMIAQAARETLATRLTAIGATGAREGVIGAATEAAIQPQVQAFNRQSGVEYTASEAALNVGMAGAVGGGLGMAGHVLGLGGKALLDRWDGAKKAGHVVETGETIAARDVMEADSRMASANPYPGLEGEVAAEIASREAVSAVVEGRPLDVTAAISRERADLMAALEQVRAEVLTMRQDMSVQPGPADEIMATLTPDRLDEIVVARGRLIRQGTELVIPRNGGEGMTKIVVKHGDVPDRDILALPEILRGKNPAEQRPKTGAATEMVWRVGDATRQVSYVVKRFTATDDKNHLLSVYVETNPRKFKNFSTDMDGAPAASSAGFPPQDTADGIPNARQGQQAPNAIIARSPQKTNTPKQLPPELRGPDQKRPETLVAWLKRMGGVKDTDGWLNHMGVDNKLRPGLISGRGLDLDEAALRAWEEGFFPEYGDRPDPDSLRRALADELGPEGIDKVRASDESLRADWNAYDAMMADFDADGIDPHGLTWDQVQAASRAAELSKQAEKDSWKNVALAFLDPDAKAALDDEQALIARVNAQLMEDDIPLAIDLQDGDGRNVTISARQAMAEADDMEFGWNTATTCATRAA